jgi:hypothetical protein
MHNVHYMSHKLPMLGAVSEPTASLSRHRLFLDFLSEASKMLEYPYTHYRVVSITLSTAAYLRRCLYDCAGDRAILESMPPRLTF